ncbi:MAG: GNAT family N-acetyltransferase, partial [Gemmatimonadales bacterium]
REVATLHALATPGAVPAMSDRGIRELGAAELAVAPGIPTALREELLGEAETGNRIVAAFAEGRPVAFCYPGAVTEGWWDISIDTLEPFRRQGHAGRCVAHLIEELMRLGKEPVWGAMASNVASARLAAKLGFTPVDALVVFSRGS